MANKHLTIKITKKNPLSSAKNTHVHEYTPQYFSTSFPVELNDKTSPLLKLQNW